MEKVWSAIEKNRWLVLMPVICIGLWFVAMSCTPVTLSPLDPTRQVNALELKGQFIAWQKNVEAQAQQFELASEDINEQKQKMDQFKDVLVQAASGNVADLPGLLTLVLGGGGLGVFFDNLRKNGVIAGLKRNKTAKA